MVNLSVSIDQKSDEKANKFREAGNVKYKKAEHLNALTFYNKCISYASSKKAISLGYANRSAVYLTLGYYDECLKNIIWARENDYPTEKLPKLKEREENCKKLILEGTTNIAEDPWNFFKLSYPANEKIPWIVDCLDVRTTKKYGRGIYATKDLKAGDVISIEKPFIACMEIDAYYNHCANCFKTCMLNLIPCSQTASMMFCSEECMDKFHTKTMEMEVALNDDMRMLSEVSMSFGGYEEFDDLVYKTDLKDFKKTIFDFDFSNSEHPEYDKNLAICFLSLSSQKDHSVNDDSCSIYKFVSKKTSNHILSLIPLNFELVMYNGDLLPKMDSESISIFKSLINHSCLPNVFFVHIENKIVGFVIKPVKAGEQLFRCYYYKDPFLYYQYKAETFQKYNFICDCQECILNNYQFKLFKLPILIMSRKDFQVAKEMLKENWQKLNSNSQDDWDNEMQNFVILSAFGYYATFPN